MEKVRKIPQCADEYRAELDKIWENDAHMKEYCMRAYHAYMLPSGYIYKVELPGIEKNMCFGYSDYGGSEDFHNAHAMAERAKRDESMFIRHNMERAQFLRTEKLLRSPRGLVLMKACDRSDRMAYVAFGIDGGRRPCDYHGHADFIMDMTPGDREFLLAVLEQERAVFEGRLRSYLKRYGLSKVRTWAYWRDE